MKQTTQSYAHTAQLTGSFKIKQQKTSGETRLPGFFFTELFYKQRAFFLFHGVHK